MTVARAFVKNESETYRVSRNPQDQSDFDRLTANTAKNNQGKEKFTGESPRLPVLAGRDSLHLLENAGKIIGIVDADTGSCLLQSDLGEAQELFGFSDAGVNQIAADGGAVLLAEPAHQIVLVEMKFLGQKIKRQILRIVCVQIEPDSGNVAFCRRRIGWFSIFIILVRTLFRIPGLLHDKRQKRRQGLIELHVAGVAVGQRDLINLVQECQKAGTAKGRGVEHGAAAPLQIFPVDAGHHAAVKVNPFKLPEVAGGGVRVGPAAVQKHTVSGAKQQLLTVTAKAAAPGNDEKQQVGGEPVPAAGVRLGGAKRARLLQVQKALPGEGGRRVDVAAGGDKIPVKFSGLIPIHKNSSLLFLCADPGGF